MIHIRIITFFGLKGAEFLCSHAGTDDGVAIDFTVDMNHVFGERQAFKLVEEQVRRAGLAWVEPRSNRWVVYLDKLKQAARPALDGVGWLQGKAEVRPELDVKVSPQDLSGLMPPSPPDGRVTLLIRQEYVMTTSEGVPLFYSYSHKDEHYRKRLEAHLSTLKQQGLIVGWHDRQITPGSEWNKEIVKQLETARIILLLISADFLHSEFCSSVELKRAMERHESGDACVIPIIVKPCDWHSALFGKLQALPQDGKAITKWRIKEEAYLDIVKGIRSVIEELDGDD